MEIHDLDRRALLVVVRETATPNSPMAKAASVATTSHGRMRARSPRKTVGLAKVHIVQS
jgi:hypothetical protein